MVISDFIEYSKKLYTIAEFTARYQVKTRISKTYRPKNSFLNSILSADIKGVAYLYRLILPKGNQILGELTDKWRNKA